MDLSNGLLGLGGLGGFSPQPAQNGLLAQYMDPEAMRKAQIKRAMLQAGIGMLQGSEKGFGNGLAQGLAGGLQGYQGAEDAFLKNAQMQYGFDQQARQDARTNTEYGWKLEERQRLEEQRKHMDQVIGTLPPELQGFAKADPEGFMKEYIKNKAEGPAGDEYGLNPIWTQNAQTGEWMLLQPSKSGGAPKPMQFPEGFDPAPQNRTVDTGTGFVTMPTRGGGQPTGGVISKNLKEKEIQEAVGQAEGKAIASAPSDMQAAETALNLVEQLKVDPYRQRGTGFSSMLNSIPGTGGYDFQTKVDQAKSGAFLTAIQQMRGLGTLSNAEGQTATSAITRMNTATTEQGFMDALTDYETIVRKAYDKAAGRIGADPLPANGGNVPDVSQMTDEQLRAILNGQ